ncbi:hypothetical protein [Nevskia ramosa]|uniref:hypothetical protein n=1 Tax=Nevskia ramosa TaxID=64002 RepID=UPI002354765A|nr:hypothetical protein [Nevskia ramosa]
MNAINERGMTGMHDGDRIEKVTSVSSQWPQDRLDELELLRTLLNAVSFINTGSHCLQRIQFCIDTAEQLTCSDLITPRSSFMNFLIDQASFRGTASVAATGTQKLARPTSAPAPVADCPDSPDCEIRAKGLGGPFSCRICGKEWTRLPPKVETSPVKKVPGEADHER